MQYQVLMTGRCLWASQPEAALFECFVLNEKLDLDAARAPLLADIAKREVSMPDDVLLNKAATIERCVARAREEFALAGAHFATDFTRQDAAVLNVQRACEAALDMGQYLIRRDKLGIPQSARDVFALLATVGWIEALLADRLQKMVGFRNIAVHDYQALLIPIVTEVITRHLDDFGVQLRGSCCAAGRRRRIDARM